MLTFPKGVCLVMTMGIPCIAEIIYNIKMLRPNNIHRKIMKQIQYENELYFILRIILVTVFLFLQNFFTFHLYSPQLTQYPCLLFYPSYSSSLFSDSNPNHPFQTLPPFLSFITPDIFIFYNRRLTISMDLRRPSRYNTALVPRSVGKKSTMNPIGKNINKDEIIQQKKIIDIKSHQAMKYIKNPNTVSGTEFKKFATLLYRGLYYSVNNLKGPSEQFIKKKSVNLPEPKNSKKKILLLDLDETLIHSIFTSQKTQISFTLKGDQFKFNIRPYCLEFLSKMSQLYTIYVFTASTADYAEPIVDYLNEKKKTIYGVLNRRNCMETHNGFYIKDLRIIRNRSLKDMIIVDNLVHSFGLQIDNGIPILEYLRGDEDTELTGLEKMLREMVDVDDVREYLRKNLNLKEVLKTPEEEYINFEENEKRHKTFKL